MGNPFDTISLAPCRGNLILVFLLERLRLGIAGVAAIAFIVFSLVTIVLNHLDGTLLPTPDQPNALLTLRWVTHCTMVPLLVPALAGVAVVVYRQIPRMFTELTTRGIVSVRSRQDRFFADFQRLYESRTVNGTIFAFLLVLAGGWGIVNSRYPAAWTHSSSGLPTIAGLYWIMVGCLGLYVLIHLAFTILVTFWALKAIFSDTRRFKINLQFMHPDHCGGLRPMSDFVLRVGLLLAVVGLALSIFIVTCCYRLGSVQATLELIGPTIALIAYVIVGPLIFFLPLLPAHRLMRDTKRKYQEEIRHQFQVRFRNIAPRISDGQLDTPALSEIAVLHGLQQYVDDFPVWPFDLNTIKRFVSMVVLPLMPIAGIILRPVFAMLSERLFR